ncbi:MAG TPA: pitrilysin family protein [Planctomycetota bacterium]|nr:pitrilysin family protein [Planctomycetota bacterium]
MIPSDRIVEARIGEEARRARVRGLPVLLARKPGQVRATGVLGVRFGSCDREFVEGPGGAPTRVPDGVAHFLEHKLFEGRTVPVFQRYAELGAACNAATSFRTTHYYFTCTDHFETCLAFLLDFVQNPSITPERVEKEKGIIEQEIRMYLDNPGWRVFFNLLGALYERHPVRNPPGGTVDSVRSITAEDCLRCHRAFYRPGNLVLVAAGDFDPEALLSRIEGWVAGWEGPEGAALPVSEEGEVRTREVEEKMTISRPRVLLGFRSDGGPGPGEALIREDLAGGFALEALFGRSSEVFQDLYRRGVIDESFSASATVETDFAFTVLGGETSEPARFREELLVTLERAKREGIRPEDFERVRRRHVGSAVRRYQSSESTAMGHLREALRGLPPFAHVRALEEARLEEAQEWLRRLFRPDRLAVSVLLPA